MSGHIAISLPTASSYCSTNTTWSLKGLDAFMYFIGRWGFFPACFLVLDLFQRYFKSRFLLQSSESIMPTYTSSIWIWWQLSICRRSWEGYWHGVFTAIWRYRKCMKPHSLWTLDSGTATHNITAPLCHGRKSTGGVNYINDGSISFWGLGKKLCQWASGHRSRALELRHINSIQPVFMLLVTSVMGKSRCPLWEGSAVASIMFDSMCWISYVSNQFHWTSPGQEPNLARLMSLDFW